MHPRPLLRAFLLAVAVTLPGVAAAEGLRVQSGTFNSTLNVPVDSAVVVRSDEAFVELSIANPAIADIISLSDNAIYVLGRAPGRTTLTILGPGARLIGNVEVHVGLNLAEIRERLRQVLPGEPIEVRTASDGLVLSGIVSSAGVVDRAMELAGRYAPERVSNLMSVGGSQQVMLKVRFAEMSRAVSKSLGAQFGANISAGSRTDIGAAGGGPLGVAAGALGVRYIGGSAQFAVLLEALETRGLVRILAEPNLVALSGQEAKFLAGGEFPIPTLDPDDRLVIEYKPFGVELNFTPFVLGDGVVNLALNAAVSGIDPTVTVPGPFPINAFSRRETSTTVELRDGESFAIAGLLQDDFRSVATQVPWFGDIPVLGALFRSAEYQREQSELVIVITAHLVNPSRGRLALPTDRVRLPSEADLFLRGRTGASSGDSSGDSSGPSSGAAAEITRQGFGGAYGYVMD